MTVKIRYLKSSGRFTDFLTLTIKLLIRTKVGHKGFNSTLKIWTQSYKDVFKTSDWLKIFCAANHNTSICAGLLSAPLK